VVINNLDFSLIYEDVRFRTDYVRFWYSRFRTGNDWCSFSKSCIDGI